MVTKRPNVMDVNKDSDEAFENEDEIETDTDGSNMSEENDNGETEPAPKKVKRDVTKEAEKELATYDAIAKDSEIKFTEKLSKISSYLRSVFENSVNTLEFQTNFNDWVKLTLVNLLGEGIVATEEFYEFLCIVLKVAPTVIEPTCEKVLNFIFTRHHFSSQCNLAFEDFMEQLSYTFEKLRRYPKLIAKFLCCVRDNANGVNDHVGSNAAKKFMKKMLGYKSKEKIVFILPKKFMESYVSVISMLSAGQVVDLWKTLQHNLEEECIKKYNSSSATPIACFLSVVVDLVVTFLSSVKVVDYSVPASTVEKVIEMMSKLEQNSISGLAELFPQEYDPAFTSSFLKLCNGWGQLHHFLCIYNENYSNKMQGRFESFDFQQAVDVSLLFPQLSSDKWLSLWTEIEKNEDNISTSLMVNLVVLKLNCLAVIQQNEKRLIESTKSTENGDANLEENELLQRNLQESAKFLWDHQKALKVEHMCGLNNPCEDILRTVSAYLQQDELMEYGKTFLESTLVPTHSSSTQLQAQSFQRQLLWNIKFRVAVVLESLHEVVKRIGKGNCLKGLVKRFLSGCLSLSSRNRILKCLEASSSINSFDEDLKKSLLGAVQTVNDVIKDESVKESEDIPVCLLKEIILVLSNEELALYPRTVRTIIFLSVLFTFIALLKYCPDCQEVLDEIISILSECGRKSQGNDVLFKIEWVSLFGLVRRSSNHLSENGIKSICALVLENIYVSPKIAGDFGDQYIKCTCEDGNLDLESTKGNLTLCVLDHILEEVTGAKTKSTSLLMAHSKQLCLLVKNKLSDGAVIAELHDFVRSIKKNKRKSFTTPTMKNKSDKIFVSRVSRCCYLILKGKPTMDPKEVSEIDTIGLPYLNFALDYLDLNGLVNIEEEYKSKSTLHHCILFLIEALKAFQDYREKLPQDFLVRAWNSLCALDQCNGDVTQAKLNTELGRAIMEVSNESEFQSICDLIIKSMDKADATQIAYVLNSLINAETGNEKKKQIRRSAIELALFKYLHHINSWKNSDDFMQYALPYINFQISLLKRRKPMGSLSTLSVCMLSITSLPLDRVESVESFKTAFALICDLLNALNVHRLDVIAFRSHVFVQCFQFVVENLVKRADQKNKLSDNEIYYLRQCAHCVERICQSAKLGRDELARVSPYLLVILMRQFEKVTVYPSVKNPLLNGCYKLLDMCDDHGKSHVNSMLSPGSREIFKTVHDLYKKFYRYKGKV